MAGITDMPFRRLIKQLGAGAVISEFVSAHAVVLKVKRTEQYLAYHPTESPVGIQIFGHDPEVLAEAAVIVQDRGVDFVDINLGCPVPKVTRKGGGSAWMMYPTELGAMLKKVKSRLSVPLTIKIRLGWDEKNKNAKEILKIARESGVEWVAIHGRTRAQGYSGQSDWNLIRELASEKIIRLIGNGDLVSGPLAMARLYESGCDGVMIARGALKNPWIFQEAVEADRFYQSLGPDEQNAFIAAVFQHHQVPAAGFVPEGKDAYQRKVKQMQPKPVDYTAQFVRLRADRDVVWLVNQHLEYLRELYPETRATFNIRKFLAWYAAGYPGAHEFRKYLFTHESLEDILAKTYEFFEGVKALGARADQVREEDPLFSSGHG